MSFIEKKASNEEVREMIEMEGLDYCILEYLSESDIEDPVLAKLWVTARKNLEQICLIVRLNEET